MDRREKLLLLSTFIVGVFIGVYAYFAGFSSVDQQLEEATESLQANLVIIGEAYGGCDRGDFCPSFRIAEDGSYRYFYRPGAANEEVLREGSLPDDLFTALENELTEQSLLPASQPTQPAVCSSYTDGIDVRYSVTLREETYILDSCGTAVDGESQMWRTLGQIWNYFETVG